MIPQALAADIKAKEDEGGEVIPAFTGLLGVGQNGAVLPQYIDEAERVEGLDLWKRMRNEPVLMAADDLLRMMVLETPPDVIVPEGIEKPDPFAGDVDPAVQAEYDRAEEIRAFIERNLKRIRPGLGKVLWALLAGYSEGHKLCEQVRELAVDEGETRLVLRSLKPKPRRMYGLAVTRFMDFVGAIPGNIGLVREFDPNGNQEYVPAEDLLLFTPRSDDMDPRGVAAFRACYDPWYRKQQAKPESIKYTKQFGGGMLTLTLPPLTEGEPPEFTINGRKWSRSEYYQSLLVQMAAGGALTLPQGAEFGVHTAGGEGKVFENSFDRTDREMVLAFLKVTRATQEAQNGSKADSETATDLLSSVVNFLRRELCDVFKHQVFEYLVRVNFGEDAVKYTPELSMKTTTEADIPSLVNALSNGLTSGAITPRQAPWWDAKIGQPVRSQNEVTQAQENKAAASQTNEAPDQNGQASGGGSPGFSFSADSVYGRFERTLHRQAKRIDGATAHLAKTGDVDTWYRNMDDLLTQGHEDCAKLGKLLAGNRALLTAEDQDALADFVAHHMDHLDSFKQDILDGRYTDDEGNLKEGSIRSRARAYVKTMRGTANEFFRIGLAAGE